MDLSYLADENFRGPSVRRLRDVGLEVAWIREDSPGISDVEVLARATRERRILLTSDRDHGEIIFGQGVVAPPGVVYFRYTPTDQHPEELADRLLRLIRDGTQLLDNFTIVGRHGERQRSLR